MKVAVERFQRDGFVVMPGVIGGEQVSELIAAVETAGVKDKRGLARNLTSKVPAIKALADSTPIRELVKNALGTEGWVVRGLLFDKTRAANWNVAWHQDLLIAVCERKDVAGYGPWSLKEGVVHVQPPTKVLEKMVTLRLHLDDCGEDNGPLRVIPGSHQFGVLLGEQIDAWRERVEPNTCIVPRGGVLLMRPLLLHASSAAKNPGHRRVVHLEFASGELDGGLQWHTAE